ncbi:MAG: hypothetical protein AAF621_01530, partial [Pseudomonadota bacterium]
KDGLWSKYQEKDKALLDKQNIIEPKQQQTVSEQQALNAAKTGEKCLQNGTRDLLKTIYDLSQVETMPVWLKDTVDNYFNSIGSNTDKMQGLLRRLEANKEIINLKNDFKISCELEIDIERFNDGRMSEDDLSQLQIKITEAYSVRDDLKGCIERYYKHENKHVKLENLHPDLCKELLDLVNRMRSQTTSHETGNTLDNIIGHINEGDVDIVVYNEYMKLLKKYIKVDEAREKMEAKRKDPSSVSNPALYEQFEKHILRKYFLYKQKANPPTDRTLLSELTQFKKGILAKQKMEAKGKEDAIKIRNETKAFQIKEFIKTNLSSQAYHDIKPHLKNMKLEQLEALHQQLSESMETNSRKPIFRKETDLLQLQVEVAKLRSELGDDIKSNIVEKVELYPGQRARNIIKIDEKKLKLVTTSQKLIMAYALKVAAKANGVENYHTLEAGDKKDQIKELATEIVEAIKAETASLNVEEFDKYFQELTKVSPDDTRLTNKDFQDKRNALYENAAGYIKSVLGSPQQDKAKKRKPLPESVKRLIRLEAYNSNPMLKYDFSSAKNCTDKDISDIKETISFVDMKLASGNIKPEAREFLEPYHHGLISRLMKIYAYRAASELYSIKDVNMSETKKQKKKVEILAIRIFRNIEKDMASLSVEQLNKYLEKSPLLFIQS